MSLLLLLTLSFSEPIRFIKPEGASFAGRTEFVLETDYPADAIIGIEILVNGQSAHYFEEAPYTTDLDLSYYPQGNLTLTAILYLYEGEEYRTQIKGRNFADFIRENVHLVRIPVMVQDPLGADRYQLQDFEIFEDGKPQQSEFLLSEDKPLELVVLLDLSGSMEKRVFLLRRGVTTMIECLKPGDSIQIIGFNHRVFEISPPSTDLAEATTKLSLLEAQGSTNLYGALWSGLKSLRKSNQRRALVIFTDGRHELDQEEDPYEKKMEDCTDLAREIGIPIYTMGLGFGYDPAVLRELAEATGGKAFVYIKPKMIHKAFETIGRELRHQYLLCYYSKTTKSGWYDINVKIRENPDLDLRYPKKLYFNK